MTSSFLPRAVSIGLPSRFMAKCRSGAAAGRDLSWVERFRARTFLIRIRGSYGLFVRPPYGALDSSSSVGVSSTFSYLRDVHEAVNNEPCAVDVDLVTFAPRIVFLRRCGGVARSFCLPQRMRKES